MSHITWGHLVDINNPLLEQAPCPNADEGGLFLEGRTLRRSRSLRSRQSSSLRGRGRAGARAVRRQSSGLRAEPALPLLPCSSGMAGCARGALIVLEGVDRAGKSTQCRRLVEALRGRGQRAELLRFPDRTTEIGRLISCYLEKKSELDDHTVHLLFSANRWEQASLMKEKLHSGVTLVVDRYAFSGVAFTSAKEDFSLDWCKQPDVGLPKPDLILFLDLSAAEAERRGGFGIERYETSAFQKKVLQRFHELRQDKALNWKVIDASKSIEDLHEEIRTLAEEAMKETQMQPIGELWR